ncbi:sialoadhesin-like [Sardina pilchardus]|uniref:sialoadhesin-like n=1 Tax=Sardina pilchardus TaxID=27697 RepID=UPI002E12097F
MSEFDECLSLTRGEWYKERSGRARQHNPPGYDCSLKIDTLSNDHSGVYHFRYYTTLHRSWITGRSGVEVFVTDLAVREDPDVGHLGQIKLNCSALCSLGSDLHYIWYKNGQRLRDKTSASILLDATKHSEEGSYSCAISRYEKQRSPAVCAPDTQCWGVAYTSQGICVLMGSSVDISCTYKYPRDHRIKKTFWFNHHKSNQRPQDLSLDSKYAAHMEYLGNTERNCTARLKDIRMSHSGEYGFGYITDQGGNHSGLPGVYISVTALQLLVHPDPATEGEEVTLTCNTTCSVSDNSSFIWYKSGQPVVTLKHTTRDNKLHLNPVSSEDAGSYSCAVRGHDGLPSSDKFLSVLYMPKNTSVSISHSGEIVVGSTVTLNCSSDADPPVRNYTWYMKSGAESLLRGTGETISFNVTSDNTGLYYCEAQNELGSHMSAGIHILTDGQPRIAMSIASGTLILIVLALLLVLGLVWLRKKKTAMVVDVRTPNAAMQDEASPVSSNVYTVTVDPGQTEESHVQQDVLYSNISFLYSNSAHASRPDDQVEYTSIKPFRASATSRTENDSATYSTVNKPRTT